MCLCVRENKINHHRVRPDIVHLEWLPCMEVVSLIEIICPTESTCLVLELRSDSNVGVVTGPQKFEVFTIEEEDHCIVTYCVHCVLLSHLVTDDRSVDCHLESKKKKSYIFSEYDFFVFTYFFVITFVISRFFF